MQFHEKLMKKIRMKQKENLRIFLSFLQELWDEEVERMQRRVSKIGPL